ncbi:hypothetical protein [Streptomyces sp. NPDC047141]|uniref:hypothetical protein n=1 Tax=Streptomyces sp. NPDC047141 TaxID=3155738 RepID=UPI0033D97D36
MPVTAVDGDELVKGRGGPRCMSRPVYGTAAWAVCARKPIAPAGTRNSGPLHTEWPVSIIPPLADGMA